MRRIETLIVGGGQAGLALSRLLTDADHEHVVLERGRIGERWRRERWDSLAFLTPAWANRLPGDPTPVDEEAFATGRDFAARLEQYARSFDAPIREHTTVTGVERGLGGFVVRTDRGTWPAGSVVLASGECAVPVVPWFAAAAPPAVAQLHAARYRNPAEVAPGGVLVVGAGASGHQIADELARAGRLVVLAVGRHSRAPRRYRGRDIWSWLRDLGDLSRSLDDLPYDPRRSPVPGFPLDGRDGGRTIDLSTLDAAGVRITGRLEGFAGNNALFAADLAANVARADERLGRLLARIDGHIAARAAAGGAPPAERIAPVELPAGPSAIDLRREEIGTIVWATGHRPHYPWLRVPEAIGPDATIVHDRGRTRVPGLYVLGARWQYRMTSHMVGGVGADAHFLAQHITAPVSAPAALQAA